MVGVARSQLLDTAAFGTALTTEQLEQIAARLSEILRNYAEADTRKYPRLRRSLRPRWSRTIHPLGRGPASRDPQPPPPGDTTS
ncbi:DUF6374 family protein [Nocardia sp. CY41]|uniref:DUF6374 family protein n=1 Tax=Nocardia sp. CY41 TaxID=2608686 RepID=UPI003FA55FD1